MEVVMPNVCVELSGRYDMGYTVMVNPWLAVVSKKKKGTITWKGSHPLKINKLLHWRQQETTLPNR